MERYEQATGIEYVHDRFYRALAVYKLAALGEMFYRRYLEGNSDDPMYPRMEERVPDLAIARRESSTATNRCNVGWLPILRHHIDSDSDIWYRGHFPLQRCTSHGGVKGARRKNHCRMADTDIRRVTVLGAGNMGHGITEVAAIAGYDVTMRDIEEEFVTKGYESIEWSLQKLAEKGLLDESAEDVLDRIDTAVDLEDSVADADLVIEAVPERMDLKREVFIDLDEFAPEDALLASNTSSLSVTEMAGVTSRPEDVVGMHFSIRP